MPQGLDVTSLLVETLHKRSAGITLLPLLVVTIDNLTVEVISISAVNRYRDDGS
jgi:hypothetical protein